MEDCSEGERRISEIEAELAKLNLRRNELLKELSILQQRMVQAVIPSQLTLRLQNPIVNCHSTQEEKILLFQSLFHGRDDVFPRRFENVKTGKSGNAPVCKNEWVPGICTKPKIPCQECNFRAYIPISEEIIRNHLRGNDPKEPLAKDFTVGVYPLLLNETCWFLAVDFDKATWVEDARAFVETCSVYQIPAALERSRSGNGGHVWIFFETPIQAAIARKLGSYLLTKTMSRRPEIGLDSYDRLFPSQDTMPNGGFGNLIALPLQKKPRERGNSVFVDQDIIPYPDQWEFLSSIQKITLPQVEQLVGNDLDNCEVTGVRAVLEDETENSPWMLLPSKKVQETAMLGLMPDQINLVLSNQIYVEKDNLPAPLRNRIIRLAAFQNPEFYKAQRIHLSTFGKPRIINCCEDYPKHLAIPRGCYEELTQLLDELKIHPVIQDERINGQPVSVEFHGNLRAEQQQAANKLLQYDMGVLSASTAFGKTVIGAWMIAQRKVSTLILVHRRQLMDQWVERLQTFLEVSKKEIGQIGGGKRKATGIVDVAMVQSLIDKGVVNDLVAKYGQVVVDECHHISASSFEQVIRQAKARYILGLSATVTRQDGHHPIIFMQCGPVRYRVDDRQQATMRSFSHTVITRRTRFTLPARDDNEPDLGIQGIYSLLTSDQERNQMIVEDVLAAIQMGRSPVLLTERREHLEYFLNVFTGKVHNVIVLSGGMSRKQRTSLMDRMIEIPEDEERLIISTGRYLGEGFDDARLDTLFLALPIAWRGTVAQYAGRLHRDYDGKGEVIIYDYVDDQIPVLAGMFGKRKKGYKAIGYMVS
jgi:superfamily II DNA or RNA helicase